jgi:hypothetical protein
MKKKAPARDPLLLELVAAIGAGRIEIGTIHDDESFVHGVCEGDRVTINPSISVVDTALHEVLHRLRPGFSERAVRAKVTRLMRSLSMAEIDRLYGIVLATAKTRKTPKHL